MNFLKKLSKNTSFPIFVIMTLFIVLNMISTPGSLSRSFIRVFFTSNAALVCVAVAMALVIKGGGIDISLGALIGLINVIFVQLHSRGLGILFCVVLSLLIAMLCGLLNGISVAFFRIPPMLATFASQMVFIGLALTIMPLPGGRVPSAFRKFFTGSIGGVVPNAFIYIALILLFTVIIHYTPMGIKINAIGQDAQKAFVTGLNVQRVQLFTYVVASFIGGLGAIGVTANMGGADPTIGLSLTTTAIASCVIGGISLSGGRGNTPGAAFGALFLQLVVNVVVSANVRSFYQDLVKGTIQIVAIIAAVLIMKKSLNFSKILHLTKGGN
jgi:ribose transport system permease protein